MQATFSGTLHVHPSACLPSFKGTDNSIHAPTEGACVGKEAESEARFLFITKFKDIIENEFKYSGRDMERSNRNYHSRPTKLSEKNKTFRG